MNYCAMSSDLLYALRAARAALVSGNRTSYRASRLTALAVASDLRKART